MKRRTVLSHFQLGQYSYFLSIMVRRHAQNLLSQVSICSNLVVGSDLKTKLILESRRPYLVHYDNPLELGVVEYCFLSMMVKLYQY